MQPSTAWEVNKNSNCSVDRAISELEEELVKLSPDGGKINSSTLAQATMLLNSKIRNRGYTAAEVHFARDSHNNDNLVLDDSNLKKEQKHLREQNHAYTSRSRAPHGKKQSIPDLQQGDLVFVKAKGQKHTTRDPHIVIGKDHFNKIHLRKALNTLHSASGSTSLSHKTKIVDPKFLFKPESFHRSNLDEFEDSRESIINIRGNKTPDKKPWNPISQSPNEDLFQICDDPALLTMEHPSRSHISTETFHDSDQISNSPTYSPHISTPALSLTSNEDSTTTQEQDTLFLDGRNNNSVGAPPILIFNDGESPNTPEHLLQDRRPKVGDHISFFDATSGSWKTAHIMTDLNRRWRHYYNIMYENGTKDGLYLKPETRWTFLNWRTEEVELPRELNHSHPSDDAECPSNPTLRSRHNDETHSFQAITFHSPSSQSSDDSSSHPQADLTGAADESLEWDMVGTELEPDIDYLPLSPCHVVLNRVSDLEYVLPLSPNVPTSVSSVLLNDVSNLDAVLPITSSPVRDKTRISRPRQLLPKETRRSRSFTPSFLRNLNIFKKFKKL